MMPEIIRLQEAGSTNTELAAMADVPDGTVVTAYAQTAGRGQRGNGWESEAGKNITLSIVSRPKNLTALMQFALSEAAALATAKTVERFTGVRALVKWPNDVYTADDRKIAGILIENSLAVKRISRAITGVGLNVNQTRFLSPAPNPVSMAQLAGHTLDRDSVETVLIEALRSELHRADNPAERESLHEEYMSRLWRGTGVYQWSCEGIPLFSASICRVELTGHLVLEMQNGTRRAFAFKEVKPIIEGRVWAN